MDYRLLVKHMGRQTADFEEVSIPFCQRVYVTADSCRKRRVKGFLGRPQVISALTRIASPDAVNIGPKALSPIFRAMSLADSMVAVGGSINGAKDSSFSQDRKMTSLSPPLRHTTLSLDVLTFSRPTWASIVSFLKGIVGICFDQIGMESG